MNRNTELDLGELADIMERLAARFDRYTEEDQIDIAARLKPIVKACNAMDATLKDSIKKRLRHKEGVRLGHLFKAVLKLVDTKRLDQSGLKEAEPEIFEEYCKECTDERVTFEVR